MRRIKESEDDEVYGVNFSKLEDDLKDFLDVQYSRLDAKVAVVDIEHFEEDGAVDDEETFPAYRFLEFAAKESGAEVLSTDEEFKELVFCGSVDQVERMYEDTSWTEEFENLSEYHSIDEIDVSEYNSF